MATKTTLPQTIFKPLSEQLVLLPDPEVDTAGKAKKIILPDNAKAQFTPARGTVLRVGPGRSLPREWDEGFRVQPQVKRGDYVIYSKYAGDRFMDESIDREVIIMREADISAVIESLPEEEGED